MNRYEYLVLTDAIAGTDEEFNRWYDQQHLADVLAVPGFVSARRFRVMTSASASAATPTWQYVAIYEMECDDPTATLAELHRRAGTQRMPISNTLQAESTATFVLRQISRAPLGSV